MSGVPITKENYYIMKHHYNEPWMNPGYIIVFRDQAGNVIPAMQFLALMKQILFNGGPDEEEQMENLNEVEIVNEDD